MAFEFIRRPEGNTEKPDKFTVGTSTPMFAEIDTLQRRIWLVKPYNSCAGNEAVAE